MSAELDRCLLLDHSFHKGRKVKLQSTLLWAAFSIVCFCFCEFRTVSHSGSCTEQGVDFAQSMLVFVFPCKQASRVQPDGKQRVIGNVRW